ncbi:MAG: HupE/UreJ family protein [Nitrospirae bacterium]|nr:HupE/UreJ family protein [Nitrospirota bacterium]
MRDDRRLIEVILIAFVMILLPAIAASHINSDDSNFFTGLRHPVFGFDHLIAMVTVGLLSAQLGGMAIWTVPATFVSVMVIGGVFGMNGIGLPLIEYGIAVSVLALGGVLALARKLPTSFAMAFVGIFAMFHGYAHGTEMPRLAEPALYALGFSVATAGLHIIGAVTGYFAVRDQYGAKLLRITGAIIAMSGVYFVLLV